jgi:2-methylcitrate dehydratase PrpD
LAVGKGVSENASFVSAQFSIPYVVAACMQDGDLGPAQLTEKRVAAPELLALSRKVEVVCDDELNRAYPERTSTRVEMALSGGKRVVRQVDIPKGDPRDPMKQEDLVRKVKRFAGPRDPDRLDRAIRAVLDLENLGDIRDLTELV